MINFLPVFIDSLKYLISSLSLRRRQSLLVLSLICLSVVIIASIFSNPRYLYYFNPSSLHNVQKGTSFFAHGLPFFLYGIFFTVKPTFWGSSPLNSSSEQMRRVSAISIIFIAIWLLFTLIGLAGFNSNIVGRLSIQFSCFAIYAFVFNQSNTFASDKYSLLVFPVRTKVLVLFALTPLLYRAFSSYSYLLTIY